MYDERNHYNTETSQWNKLWCIQWISSPVTSFKHLWWVIPFMRSTGTCVIVIVVVMLNTAKTCTLKPIFKIMCFQAPKMPLSCKRTAPLISYPTKMHTIRFWDAEIIKNRNTVSSWFKSDEVHWIHRFPLLRPPGQNETLMTSGSGTSQPCLGNDYYPKPVGNQWMNKMFPTDTTFLTYIRQWGGN